MHFGSEDIDGQGGRVSELASEEGRKEGRTSAFDIQTHSKTRLTLLPLSLLSLLPGRTAGRATDRPQAQAKLQSLSVCRLSLLLNGTRWVGSEGIRRWLSPLTGCMAGSCVLSPSRYLWSQRSFAGRTVLAAQQMVHRMFNSDFGSFCLWGKPVA